MTTILVGSTLLIFCGLLFIAAAVLNVAHVLRETRQARKRDATCE